jgi:hypothetical protein
LVYLLSFGLRIADIMLFKVASNVIFILVTVIFVASSKCFIYAQF